MTHWPVEISTARFMFSTRLSAGRFQTYRYPVGQSVRTRSTTSPVVPSSDPSDTATSMCSATGATAWTTERSARSSRPGRLRVGIVIDSGGGCMWFTQAEPGKCPLPHARQRRSASRRRDRRSSVAGHRKQVREHDAARSARCSRRHVQRTSGPSRPLSKPLWPVTRIRMVFLFSCWVSLFHRIGPASRGTIHAPGSSLMLCHVGRRATREGRTNADYRESAVVQGGGVPVGKQRRLSRPVVREGGRAVLSSASSRLRTSPQPPKRRA
jgi:hypothetical protein